MKNKRWVPRVGEVVRLRDTDGTFIYERVREVRQDATVWLGGVFGKRAFKAVRPLTKRERGK